MYKAPSSLNPAPRLWRPWKRRNTDGVPGAVGLHGGLVRRGVWERVESGKRAQPGHDDGRVLLVARTKSLVCPCRFPLLLSLPVEPVAQSRIGTVRRLSGHDHPPSGLTRESTSAAVLLCGATGRRGTCSARRRSMAHYSARAAGTHGPIGSARYGRGTHGGGPYRHRRSLAHRAGLGPGV